MPILVISASIQKQNKPPRNLFSTDIKVFHFMYLKFTYKFSNLELFLKHLNSSSIQQKLTVIITVVNVFKVT